MYKNVMVPLDGFASAEAVLPTAARIVKHTGAHLHLVHGLELTTRPPYGEHVTSHDWWNGGARREAERYLDEIATVLSADPRVRVSCAVIDAPVVPGILERALGCAADLLVMATHGRGPFRRFWLGNVADRIAREAELPVLFVHGTEHSQVVGRPFKRVLVPLDGSPESETMIPLARLLAAVDEGAVTLLHIAQPHWVPVPVLPFVMAGDVGAYIVPPEELRQVAHDYLESLMIESGANPTDCQLEARVSGAPAAIEILDYARSEEFDAIALTSHGVGGLRRLLLGSTADKVLRGASVPVLLFRPPGSAMRG